MSKATKGNRYHTISFATEITVKGWSLILAARRTPIAIDLVAIVAGFMTGLPFHDIDASNTVAARSDRAGVSAGIIVFVIAIITGFILINLSIAAGTQAAQIITPVILNLVSVIAPFKASVNNSITATSLFATVSTLIRIHTVSVIACLNSILNKPVPTRSC